MSVTETIEEIPEPFELQDGVLISETATLPEEAEQSIYYFQPEVLPVVLDSVRQVRRRRHMMELPIESVVDQAREGDGEAFALLVQATSEQAFSLAYHLTSRTDDAQEVVQDAYLRAFKGIKNFRGDAQFTTWLHRIVVNCANSHLKKRQKHRHLDIDLAETSLPDTTPEHDPAAVAIAATLKARLQTALGELTPRLRSVVVLRDVYDLPHTEIAEQLNITETTAKVRLHRARKLLKEAVFPVADEESEQD
jgi:RNA polymerase sigma-70 factor, ECF subfamily